MSEQALHVYSVMCRTENSSPDYSPPPKSLHKKIAENWEVLSGVGVDGVGGHCTLFCFSSLFFRLSSLFFFFLLILLGQGQTTAIYWKNGEFHSDPVCTDPVENFPREVFYVMTGTSLHRYM